MLEALIALPALLALLYGVSLVRETFLAKQAALLDARRCALLHAAAGCGDELPEGCQGVGGEGQSVQDDGRTASLVDATHAASTGGALQLLLSVPILGSALTTLFGTPTTRAHGQRNVRALSASAETRVVTGGMTLLCNERETDVVPAVQKAVCATLGLKSGPLADLCEGS